MVFSTDQIDELLSRYTVNTKFTNSEFFNKDTFKSIFDGIISHGQIFDIILDKGNLNYIRPIEAFSIEEALSLKMLAKDNYNPTDILRNAIQYKNMRLFFADIPDKDSYYYLLNFEHDGNFYISIILLKDFPADESSNIQYSIIRDIIELYFTISFKKAGIPVNYDEIFAEDCISFPSRMRSSDFMFIAYYYAYYFEALLTFIPYSAVENTVIENGISILFDPEDSRKIINDRQNIINGDSSDAVDYAYMITMSYFKSVVQIASEVNNELEQIEQDISKTSEDSNV